MEYLKTTMQQRKRNHKIESYKGKFKEKYTSIIVKPDKYLSRWLEDSHNQTVMLHFSTGYNLYNLGLFPVKSYTSSQILKMSAENGIYGNNVINKIKNFGSQEFIDDLFLRQNLVFTTSYVATKYGCDVNNKEGTGKTNLNNYVKNMWVYSGGFADFLTMKLNKKGVVELAKTKKIDEAIRQYVARKKLSLKKRVPFIPNPLITELVKDIDALKSKYAYTTKSNKLECDLKEVQKHLHELKEYPKYINNKYILDKIDEIIPNFKNDKKGI